MTSLIICCKCKESLPVDEFVDIKHSGNKCRHCAKIELHGIGPPTPCSKCGNVFKPVINHRTNRLYKWCADCRDAISDRMRACSTRETTDIEDKRSRPIGRRLSEGFSMMSDHFG